MQNKFKIITDMTGDLPVDLMASNEIDIISMPFTVLGKEYDRDNAPEHKVFYEMLSKGSHPYTSQINVQDAIEIFTKNLEAGYDVLYLTFSSGMSGTYEVAVNQIQKTLQDKYPDRKIIICDSLSGAGGLGLLVYYAHKLQKEGKTIEEIKDFVEIEKHNVMHCFIVQDLMYLSKGGRIRRRDALLGSTLNIKPILSLSSQGKIIVQTKVRGLKKLKKEFLKIITESYSKKKNDFLFFSDGNATEVINDLTTELKAVEPSIKSEITNLSYLVGSHTGNGSFGLFFLTDEPKRKKTLLAELSQMLDR